VRGRNKRTRKKASLEEVGDLTTTHDNDARFPFGRYVVQL
jgi:hypothetical protein